MDHFNYRDGELYAEDIPVSAIADRFGTPAYVYSRATLERHYRAYDDALGITRTWCATPLKPIAIWRC